MNSSLKFILLSCIIIISNDAIGQSQRPKNLNHPPGKQHTISIGSNTPLGNFSSTHISGIATNYSWSNHRFGRMDVKPVKPFGFTANAGASLYFGKKETVSGYSYKYPGYIFIHTYAGAIYNPWRKANIRLTAGPALGFYNGNTQFNIGGSFAGSYYIKERIAVSPGIILMKENGASVIWAISIHAEYSF